MTIIQDLGEYNENHLWIKREDLLPFSFGGNKARKAQCFFQVIEEGNYDSVVTYGSGSSNHCRVISNECCRRGIGCYIIRPDETDNRTFNSQMMDLFDAKVTTVPVSSVHDAIEEKLKRLRQSGRNPYFIEGGGHGDIGTEAYVQCYQEIQEQENILGIHFDYIFLASGTGTTQAGLVCGQLMSGDKRRIVGISIARRNPRGRNIVLDSIRSYLGDIKTEEDIQNATIFIDDFTTGYGQKDEAVNCAIMEALKKYGIPLDAVYTGKAFMGMDVYTKGISGKNILFIHTGGTPLFFDLLRSR